MVRLKESDASPINAILDGSIDILIHNVNCSGNLAVGIAKQIDLTFPEVGRVNWKKCRKYSKMKGALVGSFSYAYIYHKNRKLGFYNLYGQDEPGALFNVKRAKAALRNALLNLGPLKKSGKPIRYGITLIGTEFASITNEQSKALIIDVLEEIEILKEIVFDITVFNYET